jgi:hypothetical protein
VGTQEGGVTYIIEAMSDSKETIESTIWDPHQQLVKEMELPLHPIGRKHFVQVMQYLRCQSLLQTTKVLAEEYVTCPD